MDNTLTDAEPPSRTRCGRPFRAAVDCHAPTDSRGRQRCLVERPISSQKERMRVSLLDLGSFSRAVLSSSFSLKPEQEPLEEGVQNHSIRKGQ
ncbi:hypothetical protein Tco_0308761 [Tanacetum coccineum]